MVKSKLWGILLATALIQSACADTPLSHLSKNIHQQKTQWQHDHNAWLEIDVAAFEKNIRTVNQLLGGKSEMCAVVKADAYGNDLTLLMPSILKMGVSCLGIGSNEEAKIAREHGYSGVLMRVRSAAASEIQAGLKYGVEELFGDIQQAQIASEIAQKHGKTLAYHLALNSTGMSRNGLDLSHAAGKQEALDLLKLPHLKLVGLMSHFPEEEENDVRKGLKAFQSESKWLIENAKLNRANLTLHVANSFATLTVPESHLDRVRVGGLLYGDTIPSRTEYQKVMAFKTSVGSLHNFKAGATVGYDRTFTLKRDSVLANLPVGYSDGYRRVFTNKAFVLIRGHRVPVVGKVSMNTTMVDVTDFPDIQAGDEVVLFGKQGNAEITQAEIEDINGALLADLYTVWGNSNPRVKK
ncbi:alanine racemase [Alysiella filiformis]|uniref:Broad specificity amino-acid racemase n=1 Tax=Alysiella filiformis DSM 16848 TaxID=1120981 RepID=A0A286EL03_9NEIS|nr:alanine racemase [Alysiella filiformis]QMT30974.1 alanine racemase [Alysiella filiformis]UBQ56039.1 alanine racemase [Alysiella filiformis DSM 16848]SOD71595.1 alanine racemase [Alysiella filiformis DSM 16848]